MRAFMSDRVARESELADLACFHDGHNTLPLADIAVEAQREARAILRESEPDTPKYDGRLSPVTRSHFVGTGLAYGFERYADVDDFYTVKPAHCALAESLAAFCALEVS